MRAFTFTKQERILKRPEFVLLSKTGQKVQNGFFIVRFNPGEHDKTRLGITVTKRVGNAVKRNRIKRQIREFFRHRRIHYAKHQGREQDRDVWDLNLIVKTSVARLGATRVRKALEDIFTRFENRISI